MACVIGIAGGTGAGKTTLVRFLTPRFPRVCLVDLDSYYRDRSRIAPESRTDLNYDEPSAIELSLLLDHLRQLANGRAVQKPRYSFESHTRIGADLVSPAPLILVEGLLALWWEELRAVLDLKVFVDAPPGVRLVRRIRRDVTERGRDVESVLTQYLSTVRPMHERYVESTRCHADLVVVNTGPVARSMARVVLAVEAVTSRATAGARHA
jgi:uridine kinase